MEEIQEYQEKVFENVKHIDEYDNEFWYARELQEVLCYKRWDKFKNAIEKAMESCENSNITVSDHFSHLGKMISVAKGALRKIDDYKLSR